MTLARGWLLSGYEIIEPIGAGGMGQVYRARDTRLDRDVAVKVLPEHLNHDSMARSRFEREAKAIAALSHPNILAVYDVGVFAGVAYVVMELLQGQTLREALTSALPARKAVEIGIQIAKGLAAAHDKHIVHRDLKPENVFLAADGHVKILDFGLARQSAPAGPDATSAPTELRHTDPGTVMGTIGYMAPEQVRGAATDHRADIFSLGCVLYEMATGRRPFARETSAETMTAILREDPPDMVRDNATVPAAFEPIVRHCLEKRPEERFQSARDLAFALQSVASTSGASSSGPAAAAAGMMTSAASPARTSRVFQFVPWALAAMFAVVAAVFWFRPSAPAPPASARSVRAQIGLPADVEFFWGPSLSADGSKLGFVGTRQGIRSIYVRGIDDTDFKSVAGTEAAQNFTFSPDAGTLAFITTDTRLKQVTLAAGIVEPLVDGADIFSPPAFARDGSLVFGLRDRLVVRRSGAPERELATINKAAGEDLLLWPLLTPDDAMVLFVSRRTTKSGTELRLEAVPFAGGSRRVLLDNVDQPVIALADRIVYTRNSALFEVGFNPASMSVSGLPRRLAEQAYVGPTGGSSVAVSPNGTMLLAPPDMFASHLIWVSPSGVERSFGSPSRGFQNPRVSPDGRRIAFSEAGTIWTLDPERGTFTRVSTVGGPTVGFPVWSLDSKRIYYRSGDGIRLGSADGEGDALILPNTATSDYPSSVTPDGKMLVFLRISGETAGDIYGTPPAGGEVKPILATKAYEGGPQVSPDGNWLLYVSSESGRMEVCLRALAGADRKWTVSSGGGLHPLWSRDGKRAFYRSGQQFFEVDVTTSPEVRLSPPKVLFERRYEFGPNLTFPNFSISADGREFLVVQGDPGRRHLTLALDWLSRPGR